MNRGENYLRSNTFYILSIGLILSLFLFNQCSTLQKTKGYENYPKNESWQTRKL